MRETRGTTCCEQSMAGVHGGSDVGSFAVDGGAMAEVGGERYTGCSGRLKRGSGGQSNTGEGHLLVVEEQTW